jgi:CRP-like cAMP-binding protein
MSNPAALWYFENVNLYHILCPHKVQAMGEKHEFLQFKKNQFIYIPDDAADNISMVSDGRVKIGHYLEDGKEIANSILTKVKFLATHPCGEIKRGDFAQAMEDKTSACAQGMMT